MRIRHHRSSDATTVTSSSRSTNWTSVSARSVHTQGLPRPLTLPSASCRGSAPCRQPVGGPGPAAGEASWRGSSPGSCSPPRRSAVSSDARAGQPGANSRSASQELGAVHGDDLHRAPHDQGVEAVDLASVPVVQRVEQRRFERTQDVPRREVVAAVTGAGVFEVERGRRPPRRAAACSTARDRRARTRASGRDRRRRRWPTRGRAA